MSVSSTLLRKYVTECVGVLLSWSNRSYDALIEHKTEFIDWACSVPKCSTFRVNSLSTTTEEVILAIKNNLKEKLESANVSLPEVFVHPTIPDCVVIGPLNINELDLSQKDDEVIVDSICGTSVLRGSHVFAAGVMGMLPGTNIRTKVSVYADLSLYCKRGSKIIHGEGEKFFVGNGIARMNRYQLFNGNQKVRGIAIEITDPVSGVTMFEVAPTLGILQNLPSMVCIHCLDPKPGETILDMCAAPGNKATHIATLMKNQGVIVALDKSKTKLPKITQLCDNLSITCIKSYLYDSTEAFSKVAPPSISNGPPFPANSFDRILLDAPCSGLGQRPMLRIGQRPILKNEIRNKIYLSSYEVLHHKLLHNAIPLLKPGGILVYSTCTIVCEENENIISWVLENFPEMELVPATPILGGPGLSECGLDNNQLKLVQRFGPGNKDDTIGFFIAKLRKKK